VTERVPYPDRAAAGRELAAELVDHAGRPDLLVLGLPRGGVPVAARVAAGLAAPLDVLLVRKVGVPGQPELAMGAVAVVGDRVAVARNQPVLGRIGLSEHDFGAGCVRELAVLRRRQSRYRAGHERVAGRPVVVVDDGLATGSTMRAAVAVLRVAGALLVVAAAPIGAASTCRSLAGSVDALVCPWQPTDFWAVSQGYQHFEQTTDDEVIELLAGTAGPGPDSRHC